MRCKLAVSLTGVWNLRSEFDETSELCLDGSCGRFFDLVLRAEVRKVLGCWRLWRNALVLQFQVVDYVAG